MGSYAPLVNITVTGWFKTTSSGGDIVILATSGGIGIFRDIGLDEGHFALDKTGAASPLEARKETVLTFNDGEWHHFAVLTEPYNIYIDGVNQSLRQATMYRSSTKFLIGARFSGSTYSRFFEGSLDEIKIYERTLSPEQIQIEYHAGLNNYSVKTIVSQETIKGDTWRVAITPNDAYEDGITVLSDELIIENTAPENASSLTPTSGTFNNTIDISCSGSSDDDEDSIFYSIQTNRTGSWVSLVIDDEDGNYSWNISS